VQNDPGFTSADIEALILALDPESETYDADLLALEEQFVLAQNYELGLEPLVGEADRLAGEAEQFLSDENGALLALTDGRELSEAALAELRANIGL